MRCDVDELALAHALPGDLDGDVRVLEPLDVDVRVEEES
jgi:hypothetical protein